ncbi:MAG: hypothetical protein LV481_13435 [Methylacidiphilales bacterium]|nr:hypothetical protein [Candidatus Methylacidiphilales bacterium]
MLLFVCEIAGGAGKYVVEITWEADVLGFLYDLLGEEVDVTDRIGQIPKPHHAKDAVGDRADKISLPLTAASAAGLSSNIFT